MGCFNNTFSIIGIILGVLGVLFGTVIGREGDTISQWSIILIVASSISLIYSLSKDENNNNRSEINVKKDGISFGGSPNKTNMDMVIPSKVVNNSKTSLETKSSDIKKQEEKNLYEIIDDDTLVKESIIVCPNCKSNLSNNDKYCPNCGVKIERQLLCNKCQSKISNSNKYCPQCGERQICV